MPQFLLTFAFNAGTFYLAVYFQVMLITRTPAIHSCAIFQAVLGVSPLHAGLLILPYSLGSSAVSVPAAVTIDYIQKKLQKTTLGAKVAFTLGLAIACLGFGA